MPKNIIAIDGPAASGKGTLARALAKVLNFAYLDTGALYRAVAFLVLQNGGNPESESDSHAAARVLMRDFSPEILENPALRTDEMGVAASKVSVVCDVRSALLDLQRNFARNPPAPFKGAVLDGRDIGTVICPEAPVKLFITASVEIRAERRLKELHSKGIAVTYEAVLQDMQERDARDAGRDSAPMLPADDAVLIDSTHLNAAEMLEKALKIVHARLSL